MKLLSYIQGRVKLGDNDYDIINRAFKSETYPKGTLIIRPNNYSQKVFFIESGLLRTFYYKNEKDITQFFFDENKFTAPLNSIFYNQPEPYGWETLETSVVRTILYRDLTPLMDRFPVFYQFFFNVSIEMLNLFALKLESLQFHNAQERYNKMMEMYPEIILRVPLGHIASYLGITQQTLSVIRGKK